MTSLTHTRCYHHAQREAVARCPQCHHFFCRECISDYQGQALCVDCLRHQQSQRAHTGRSWWQDVRRLFYAGVGIVLAWGLFYLLAVILLKIPAQFHEGKWLP